jgi:hypothetical protein
MTMYTDATLAGMTNDAIDAEIARLERTHSDDDADDAERDLALLRSERERRRWRSLSEMFDDAEYGDV